jgi:Uma2 family endonuclease
MSAITAETLRDQVNTAGSDGIIFPPGDLWSNEPPLESDLHRDQIDLLINVLRRFWQNRQNFYVSGNLTIYYSPNQLQSQYFRGPDFFVVLGTERKSRKSWVVWEEDGKYPNVIVELLSSSTATTDRGLKKEIYQDTFRTPDYFWFDPETLEFCGFHLVDGAYQDIQPNQQGWLWSRQLQLFLGVHNRQLRFLTANGNLIPTPDEAADEAEAEAEAESQRAEAERQRAEVERQQNEKLAAKLRELGGNPEDIA